VEVERPALAISLRQDAHLERCGDSEEIFASMNLSLTRGQDIGVWFWMEEKLEDL
jgi:hypothetical protein